MKIGDCPSTPVAKGNFKDFDSSMFEASGRVQLMRRFYYLSMSILRVIYSNTFTVVSVENLIDIL